MFKDKIPPHILFNLKNSFLLTIISYLLCYIISYRETVLDFKNMALILLFSYIAYWVSSFYNNRNNILKIFITFSFLGYIVPVIGYATEPFLLQRLMKDFLFFYVFAILIILLPLVLSKKPILVKIICSTAVSISVIPLAIIGIYYYAVNSKISTDTFLAIMQTNSQEAIEFFSAYISIGNGICIIIGILIFNILLWKTFKYLVANVQVQKKSNSLILLAVIMLVVDGMFLSKTYLARTFTNAYKLNKNIQKFDEYKNQRVKLLSSNNIISSSDDSFALVIGETHNRSRMSAFGYKRDTSPWLKQQVFLGNAILLNNAFACAAQTQPALEYALTQKNQYNDFTIQESMTIVEIARAAGFNVVWLSNQQNDTIAGLIAGEADRTIWINKNVNDTYLRQRNGVDDSLVLDSLTSMVPDKRKTLYVIHLLGSHADYSCRYPENFNKWNGNNHNDAYDNSVLYNDYIMENISQILFNKFKVQAILYFADHGEELDKFYCHGTDFFYSNYKKYDSVKDIVKIPVYFLLTDEYKSKNKDIMNNLNRNSNKYFTNDMIYDTTLGLMQIQCDYIDYRYSITSEKYSAEVKDLYTIHGKVKLHEVM